MGRKRLLIWAVIVIVLSCCILKNIEAIKSLIGNNLGLANKCGIPYENFSENDILGTWQARRLYDTDTLIIQKDKTYKQVIQIQNPPLYFESEWQAWNIIYSENSTPYLHLENLRLCVAEQGIIDCSSVGGGEREWYDLCSDRWVAMPNEGVLAVIDISKNNQPVPSLELFLFPLSNENPWVYHSVVH